MDHNYAGGVYIENNQMRFKIGEVIETSVNILEKGTQNIFMELNKLREEYSYAINKFVEYCDKEGISIGFFEESKVNSSRTFNLDKDNSILSASKANFSDKKSPSYLQNYNGKQTKVSTFEVGKIKPDSKSYIKSNLFINNSHSGNTTSLSNITNIKNDSKSKSQNKNNNYNNNLNINIKESTTTLQTQEDNITNQRNLQKIEKLSNLTEFKNNFNIFKNKSSHSLNNQNKVITPTAKNKSELKNLINLNPNNNYSKKFIKKKSYEMTNLRKKSKSSNSKDNSQGLIRMPSETYNNTMITGASVSISNNFDDHFDNYENKIKSNFNNQIKNNINLQNKSNLNNLQNLQNENLINSNSAPNNIKKIKNIKDDRKFSILDVDAEIGSPLIKNFDVNNFEFNFNEDEEENNSENEAENINEKINLTNNIDNNIDNFNYKINNINDSICDKNIYKNIKNKNEKLFYILSTNEVFPLKLRLKFSSMTKNIKSVINNKHILKNYKNILTRKISKIDDNISNPEIEKLISKSFVPSKTAQNGLNFITKIDEFILADKDVSICNYEELTDIFKFIFIILRQNYENLDERLLPDYLFNNIMAKLKTDNLKSLFLNIICNNLIITSEQHSKIVKLVENNKNIINPNYMFKVNKTVAYLCFIIKEIYQFINLKTENGLFVLNLKKQKLEANKYKEKIMKIEILLEQIK